MIKGEHLHSEINDIKKVADDFESKGEVYEAAVLKAHTLALKLLLNIRQNQTKMMEKQGIPLIIPKGRNVSTEQTGS